MGKRVGRLFFIILVILSLFGCDRTPEHAEVDSAEAAAFHLNKGIALARQGSAAEALSEFEKASVLDPGHLGAYYNMAIAHSELGHLDQEENFYQQVLQRSPQATEIMRQQYLPAAYFNLAIIELKRGAKGQAYLYLEKTLSELTDIDSYYHLMMQDKDLAPIRDEARFTYLMRQYWPDYGVVSGVNPKTVRVPPPPAPPGP